MTRAAKTTTAAAGDAHTAQTTAADQLRRILQVIPRLSDDGDHPLDEIAEQLGVDVTTLRDDLWSIANRFDVPGGFVEGLQLYIEAERVSVVSNHFRRPMRLTLAELRAIELGLAMLRAERAPDEHDAINRARERLRAVIAKLPKDPIPDDERRHASLGAGMRAVRSEHLASVRSALRTRRKLRLEYRRANASEATSRTVRPYAMVAVSGMLYLLAHNEESDTLRVFRLDRVEGAQLLKDSFTVPESFSVDKVLRDGRALIGETPATLRIRYSARIARWIAEREGTALDADGSVTVEHPLVDVDWAVRHVLQYGPEAEVLAPGEVRQAVRERLEAMAGQAA